MASVGWGDKMCQTFILNVINTLPDLLANSPRHKKIMRDGEGVSEKELIIIPRPKCAEFMINYFSILEGYNYLRQGTLAMGNGDTVAPRIYCLD